MGEKNSTVPELDAYIHGYKAALGELGDYAGLSKISVATGTAHGGILLPDGTQADVAVDFDTLEDLGERRPVSRFGAGAGQHGASTLPDELFSKFPETQTIEIHLATGFSNTFLDHPSLPESLRQEMYAHLDAHHADERGANDSDLVFHLKTRKNRPLGRSSRSCGRCRVSGWRRSLPVWKSTMLSSMKRLNVAGTRELVDGIVTPVAHHRPMPVLARGAGDDQGLAD